MLDLLEEYIHLQKTRVGIKSALKEKEVELSRKCRELISGIHMTTVMEKRMAEIILENINGK